MIRVENLRKCYGPTVAVDGISFEIAAGETFGLLGPNGAGKSTTIHLLVGVLRPDAGRILIDGQSDPTRREVRGRIGIAPQPNALYADLSGEENLRFFGHLYGLSASRLGARVRWALDFVGLEEHGCKRVKAYSGGMLRRLNLACALLHEPAVLLLDEPTVGIDPQSRNRIFENLESLKAAGCTILYTTHYIEEAQRLCDRVAILDRGRILALNTVEGLIETYGGRSVVTAELVEPPSDVDGMPGQLEGTRLQFETDQPLVDVGRLAGAHVRVHALRVDRPNLQTVFLRLTGRELRD